MDWEKFKEENRRHLGKPENHGWEKKFIDNVLKHMSELSPKDVKLQYEFKGKITENSPEGNRKADFVIINEEKNWCLPIELDGYTKISNKDKSYQENYANFDDFLERQNDEVNQLAHFCVFLIIVCAIKHMK